MAVLETVLTTAGGALSATLGVVVGTALSRRAQDRHWLRDRQLAAYQEHPPAIAQVSLVNAIRRSLGKDLGALSVWIGGSLTRNPRLDE